MRSSAGRETAVASHGRAHCGGLSLAVVDDNSFVCGPDGIRPRAGDFYRFMLFFRSLGAEITLCSPVLTADNSAAVQSPVQLEPGAMLVWTFPYERVVEYVRKLPAVVRHNGPVFARVMRSADLVLIRLPAANGLLAFSLARALRKRVVIFLVGVPGSNELAVPTGGPLRRSLARLAARLEWATIAWMARQVPVFAYGSHLARRLERAGAEGKIEVAFTSLVEDLPEPAARRLSPDTVSLLYVGRFAADKGVEVLLDAAEILAGEGLPIRVDVVGDGPLASRLQHHVDRLGGLSSNFHGWVSDGPELTRIFSQADIFVQPSRSEGIPKVLVKAMAHGLPIVATCAGGIPDIVTDGEQGLLVPVDDPVAMAGALRRLTFDAGLREHMGAAGREFARKHTASRQVNAIWQEILRYFPELVPEMSRHVGSTGEGQGWS